MIRALSLTALAAALGAGWHVQKSPTEERLRGVSAASDSVAWAGGNKGTVLRTTDGGETWARLSVPGAESLDFRDVEAFDAATAVALAIGPGDASRIYRTRDGGATWALAFTNTDPRAFYDAIAFWNARYGLAMGDPVDGKFTVIRTSDGGATWTPVPPANLPPALPNEGAFAASGTCLVVRGAWNAWFATGGAGAGRVFRSTDGGLTWNVASTPIAAGAPSAGVFSLAFHDARHGVAVGGDYTKQAEGGDVVAITGDGGITWIAPRSRPRAFRSAVAFVPGTKGRALVATGPSGTDVSTDGGETWSRADDDGFHALAISPKGGAAWGVGERGRVAVRKLR